MELNWSTFVLEIFNFLVLVWILKRFLYQPVLDIIAQRRTIIENQLAEAEQHHAEANALKEQYEHRLADWELEHEKATDNLHHELEQIRIDQLKIQRAELTEEEEKIRVTQSRQNSQAIRDIEQQALQQGAEFASRLLTEAAGPELQNRLFDILLNELSTMPDEQINALSVKWGEPPEHIQVSSAYPLSDDQRHQLEQALSRVTELSAPILYDQDKKLLAGLNITIGAWALQLNVRDELQGFTEFVHVER